MRSSFLIVALGLSLFCLPRAFADADDLSFGGHLKTSVLLQQFPSSSVFYAESGASSAEPRATLRLKAGARRGRWSLNADYQLAGTRLDSQGDAMLLAGGFAMQSAFPDDSRRWFDLSHDLDASGSSRSAHRLDRLWLGFTTRSTVVRFGRLALSWGNGLFYSPMDIVNPFDPLAIDTEYKTGDDMLYVQHLFTSGDDVEFATVVRRDPLNGNVESDEATVALRYNAYRDEHEYQFLAAQSYGDTLVGLGGSLSAGGAVWRADLVLTDADRWRAELVTNVSHSWVWRDRNIAGSLEFFFNGFGLRGKTYELSDIGANPRLVEKLLRGETYTLGRHYLAAGLSIEMSPLWVLSPALFANLEDHGGLLQLSSQYSLNDNLSLLAALTLPLGPEGREFRGIRNSFGPGFLSRDAALFAQLAWYF